MRERTEKTCKNGTVEDVIRETRKIVVKHSKDRGDEEGERIDGN